MTDEELDELLDGLDLELTPIYVIKTTNSNKHWYVHHIEFISGDSTIVRTIYWTLHTSQALHFHDWDEISAFVASQFSTREIIIQEIL